MVVVMMMMMMMMIQRCDKQRRTEGVYGHDGAVVAPRQPSPPPPTYSSTLE